MMTFTVEVGDPVIVGEVGGQVRRYVPLLGGKVDGDYSGIIIPGGMDWQTVMPNGCVEISARYALELEQGRVEVRSKGLRAGAPGVLARIAAGEIVPGSQYYFRTAMRFSSGSLELAALNQILAIAIGERFPNYVTLGIYPVL
ncbi:DUF3237 family protein [Novosphingobium sp. G106]|uniref:DUF3237 family protein n=1 Tax=Novosphingobium sp. G106 TaxID=2849500 RepID=UPI001C2D853B|nr:DUF3237 family protein [Novosphingobium sp. G106]MBV1687174.1 DUF3237 family protein [Novosphingobium sp. G106]